jgi:Transposase DDE domain/Domain of unknown function (DUF4372)
MSYSNTIFNQLLNFLPKNKFNQYIGQHKANKYTKSLTAWNQLVALLYAQATGKDSLREIETGFNLHDSDWHHLGIKTVARSTLSYANNNRNYQVFEKLFYALLAECKNITPEREFGFDNPLYSIDSTTVRLCLSIFDWAKYSKTKGALKLHTLLNNRTSIPELINITDGKVGDLTGLKNMNLKLEPGSILVFDRGYIDYNYWLKLTVNHVYFVSRIRCNQKLFVVGQHKTSGLGKNILADELVVSDDYQRLKNDYPKMRRIKFYSEDKEKVYEYLTNNFELTGEQIALIYKERWQIELFFKWIKQNLKIKTFLGTSKNAVMTQVWIAMIYFLLLAYIKFQTKFKKSLLELTRMIREVILLRRSLIDLLSLSTATIFKLKTIDNNPQMSFW